MGRATGCLNRRKLADVHSSRREFTCEDGILHQNAMTLYGGEMLRANGVLVGSAIGSECSGIADFEYLAVRRRENAATILDVNATHRTFAQLDAHRQGKAIVGIATKNQTSERRAVGCFLA